MILEATMTIGGDNDFGGDNDTILFPHIQTHNFPWNKEEKFLLILLHQLFEILVNLERICEFRENSPKKEQKKNSMKDTGQTKNSPKKFVKVILVLRKSS